MKKITQRLLHIAFIILYLFKGIPAPDKSFTIDIEGKTYNLR